MGPTVAEPGRSGAQPVQAATGSMPRPLGGSCYDRRMLTEAITFATSAHEGQARKGSGLPYVTHPLEVMVILIRHGVRDEDTLAAGVLHDVVEDCEVASAEIARRFGATVAEIVSALTKRADLSDAGRKQHALVQLREGPPGARIVKMADRLSNILDLQVTNWSAEKQRAYLSEAEVIADIGAQDLPSLCEQLRQVAAKQRAALAVPTR